MYRLRYNTIVNQIVYEFMSNRFPDPPRLRDKKKLFIMLFFTVLITIALPLFVSAFGNESKVECILSACMVLFLGNIISTLLLHQGYKWKYGGIHINEKEEAVNDWVYLLELCEIRSIKIEPCIETLKDTIETREVNKKDSLGYIIAFMGIIVTILSNILAAFWEVIKTTCETTGNPNYITIAFLWYVFYVNMIYFIFVIGCVFLLLVLDSFGYKSPYYEAVSKYIVSLYDNFERNR